MKAMRWVVPGARLTFKGIGMSGQRMEPPGGHKLCDEGSGRGAGLAAHYGRPSPLHTPPDHIAPFICSHGRNDP